MNRNNRRSRTQSGSSLASKTLLVEDRQLKLLKEIRDFTSTNQHVILPETPDVPRIVLDNMKVHTFHRSRTLNIVGGSIGAADGVSFKLNDLPNYTDFTNLFQQYRIVQVRASVRAQSFVLASGDFPQLYIWFDYDDASVPVAPVQFEAQTLSTSTLTANGLVYDRILNPRILSEIYQGATSTGYATQSSQLWLSTGYPGIPYFGLKYLSPGTSSTTQFVVQFEYTVQCRIPN
jgi:hypothetical protein